jgi:hypothetical protein
MPMELSVLKKLPCLRIYVAMPAFKLVGLLVALFISDNVWSQSTPPPVARFDGSAQLSFPADLSLDFSDYGTVEFWVSATWEQLDYDPTILSYLGPQGPRFAFIIMGDRQGIGMLAGDQWDAVEYDFSDGLMHHVAFVVLGDETDVFIDGQYQSTLAVTIADLPASGLHLASFNGSYAGFPGALADLRIWDAPLDGDDINVYRKFDISSEEGLGHPMIDSLVGVGYFSEGRRSILLLKQAIPVDALEEADEQNAE